MAIYRGHTITNRGRQLLAKVMAGQGEFEVSAVKFGSGRFEGNQREVTDLVNEKISLELINIRNEGAMAVVTARLTNENLLESFRAEELGIFAKIKGTNEEVLYAYTLALESDVIPDNSLGATLIIDLNIYMELSDSVDAVMTINESRVFLTLEHAKEIFSQTGLLYSGELLNMGSLQENKVYKANDGKYYKNTGGNRVWNGTGEIDDKFKEITWERLNQDILALAIEDGKNMAKILGVEDYGGILNTSDLKKAGWAYYCTQNKYIYECLSDTRLNYADAEFFEPLSNKSLLGKLKNLYDKGITDKTFQTSYGTLVIYERIIGTIKFFIFELNLNTINSGLNTLSLNKIEEVTGLNIYDYTFEVNSSYNADVNINVQYQNNTMRINSKNTKPEGNAFIVRGFSRLIYTN